MVQTTNNKQVNGITIVEVFVQDGTHHVTTILMDIGLTRYAINKVQHTKGELYHMMTGNMNTSLSVSVKNV